jgi:sugar phosphate isomerase/epimerase
MGFCCDTGHWCRCGLDPVEMLRKVAPRVKTFHLKDLEDFGVPGTKDAIWGQGKGRIADILAEVKKLDIKNPYFGIEWERDPNEPLDTHAKSAAYFEKVASELVATKA